MAYIYKITNNINDKVYIGKTIRDIQERFSEHCRDSKKDRYKNRPLYRAMNKYGIENFSIELIEETDNPEEREIYWIKKYNSYSNGYNATIGGDGKSVIDYQKVANDYIHFKNMRETAKYNSVSIDSVQLACKIYNIEVIPSYNVTKNKYSKRVIMYSLSNEYIRTFDSIKAAAQYLIDNKKTNCKIGTIHTHISEVCNGKRKSAAGYRWQFENAGVV